MLLLPAAPAVRAQGRHIYPEVSAAAGDIQAALQQARTEHKRVLLDFGADWCGDCQVLDLYLHDPGNVALLNANYVLVHVNVGRLDQNMDIAQKYGIPLKRGIPAMAVVAPTGGLLFAQANQEFEKMQRVEPADVTAFLQQWKPVHAARPGR